MMKPFKSYIIEKFPFFGDKEDNSKLTRNNYSEEGKFWYHPDNHTKVPVTQGYHSREVAIYPEKFNLSHDDLHGFYHSRGTDPQDAKFELEGLKNHDFMDWSDELVHGMHDKGWLRMNERNNHIYLGTNHADHAIKAVKKMVDTGHFTPNHTMTLHLYNPGSDGFGGKTFKLTHEQAKRV